MPLVDTCIAKAFFECLQLSPTTGELVSTIAPMFIITLGLPHEGGESQLEEVAMPTHARTIGKWQ